MFVQSFVMQCLECPIFKSLMYYLTIQLSKNARYLMWLKMQVDSAGAKGSRSGYMRQIFTLIM